MSATLGVAAALFSALAQATAHALLAKGTDKLLIRGIIGVTTLLAVLPFIPFVPLPSAELWWWLLASGALHAVYQLVLIRAYEGEDFSVAFPLARGIVPLATGILGVAYLGDELSRSALIGIIIVSAGLLYIASARRPAYAGMLAALLAGLLTTAYTVLDAYAVRLDPVLWTFVVWFFVFDGLIMGSIVLLWRGKKLKGALAAEWKPGLQAGLASLLGFSAALIALRLIPVGSAAALRETSVVFGVLIAAVFLKEQVANRRLLGALLVAFGGVLIALSR